MSRISTKIREVVRDRANQCCEYCHIPEQYGRLSFQADHIIPPMHGGGDDIDNLAWACFRCNNRKGTNISTIDSITQQITTLFHPRNENWDEHFELLPNGTIVGRTSKGRGTLKLLDINATNDVQIRQLCIQLGLLILTDNL
jgi:hypothetical protein